MNKTVEVTVLQNTDGIEVGSRVYVFKKVPLPVLNDFDSLFSEMRDGQNKEPEFVEAFGEMEVECLPLEAHRRIQTPQETREKKRTRNRLHNEKPDVREKRRQSQQEPEKKRQRQEYNQRPENKEKKTISGFKPRRALRVLKEKNYALYEQITKEGEQIAIRELQEKKKLRETCAKEDNAQLEKEISALEKELGVEPTEQ